MRVLIAEDDPVCRRYLEESLSRSGHRPVSCADGGEALRLLEAEEGPRLAVLDWMMPGLDGVEVCRRIRRASGREGLYLILVTSRDRDEDVVEGLDAGADDYLVKPFRPDELDARLRVAERVLDLQGRLAQRVRDLEESLAHVRQLQGLLPICSYCKRIRDDQDYWEQIETYITRHSDAQFSHGVCPDCFETEVRPRLQARTRTRGATGRTTT